MLSCSLATAAGRRCVRLAGRGRAGRQGHVEPKATDLDVWLDAGPVVSDSAEGGGRAEAGASSPPSVCDAASKMAAW